LASAPKEATTETFRSPAPFLKWVGGKRQLLPRILEKIPKRISGTYFEPFLGGGAVFFALAAENRLTRAILSDFNVDLIETYRQVRNNVDAVIGALRCHRNEADYFYRVRSTPAESLSPPERAARMIFLNKCGYNGLYRVNAAGQFNVPFGRYSNPTICDEHGLRAASRALQIAELREGDFEEATGPVKPRDLVYFDPPYVPLSATSSFTSYTQEGFDADDQRRLRDFACQLKKRGVRVLLSNSSAEFVREIYGKHFAWIEVEARRIVNCQPSARGPVRELLIW
jgi:DNA adenine methylase